MKPLVSIAWHSAWHRRSTLVLVVLSVALATLLLLGVERLRSDVRESFSQSVSGTDLVVGARTGSVQLMLYAVFRIGGATNNIGMSSLRDLAALRGVDWVVPLSLGDSHRGFAVLATTPAYFERFRYGDRQLLALAHRYWNDEVAGSNAFLERIFRIVFRVPHYKTGRELRDEYEARRAAGTLPVKPGGPQVVPAAAP